MSNKFARLGFAGLLATASLSPSQAQNVGSADAMADPTLPQVTVTGERADDSFAGGQQARKARLGMLGNMNVMSTPFNLSSYTAQAIADQQAVTVADVLARDPSVRATGQSGGILDAFFIRGFPIGEGNVGEIALDGQYGVAPNYRVFADYAERIEVIKGPGALLYGMSPNSGVGGVINIVPKRALDTDLTRLSVDYASDSQVGGHVDVSRRFGAARQFGVRVNGSRTEGDTALDQQTRKADVGAIALDYQGEKLRATLDVLAQQERFDAPSRPFLAGAGVAVPAAPDGRRNVTQSWEWAKLEDRALLLRAEYDLSEQLTLFANAGGARTEVARLFGTPTILNSAGDTRVTPENFRLDAGRATADAGLRAGFNTGAIRHTLTVQASAYRDRLERASVAGRAVLSNLYAPVAVPAQAVAAPGAVPKISETRLAGVAVADTLTTADERWLVTMGARRQQVESDNFSPLTGATTSSYDDSAVTPMLGVAFKPWKTFTLYANYIEGLSKGDVAPPTASNAGEVFAPYKSKQNEIGVKIDHGRLVTTLSAFQITKPSGQLSGTVFGVNGEQRNRGLELSLFGEAARGVRLSGGVTWLDAELTRTASAATLGNTPVGVPSSQANLGAEWDVAGLPGVSLTGALAYTGKQYVNQANTQSIPGWTKVDLGGRYRTTVAGKPTVFRLSLQNAANRDYWSGVASYGAFVQGAPRTVMLSATVDL